MLTIPVAIRRRSVSGVCLFLLATAVLLAQQPPAQPAAAPAQPGASNQTPAEPPPPPLPPPGQKLTSNQLDGLVAPIALYPDPLISQILVASTYPREITLAVQWLNQHPNLKGPDLNTAAQDQSWDPSIKALLAFPNVLRRLNQDKQWTTNLGNAFLAQQPEVMLAVQRMRRAAKEAGKLKTTRQMKVIETSDSGETVIEIEPAAPDVLYVPAYNPVWIWGPPLWYPYPRWFWGPPPVAAGVWFGFGPPIAVAAFYGPGWGVWGGWGGWGWRPGWVNNTVVVNNTFINNSVNTTNVTNNTTNVNNTNTTNVSNTRNVNNATTSPAASATAANASSSASGRSANAASANNTANPTNSASARPANQNQTSVWQHNPAHRQGVPYANAEVAQRFHAPPPGAGQGMQAHAQNATGRPGGGTRGGGPGGGPPNAGRAHPGGRGGQPRVAPKR